MGIGIMADAAVIPIPASGISVRYQRIPPLPDWIHLSSTGLVLASAYLSFWYRTEKMPVSLAFRHLKHFTKKDTNTLHLYL
jgi:hypothetical protein